jgi:hypothetical protein
MSAGGLVTRDGEVGQHAADKHDAIAEQELPEERIVARNDAPNAEEAYRHAEDDRCERGDEAGEVDPLDGSFGHAAPLPYNG